MTIILKNISLRFKNEPLFQNLNLTLPGNTITCLLGKSGVGKSTLLRIIAGLTKPDNQDYIIGTTSVNEAPEMDPAVKPRGFNIPQPPEFEPLADKISYLFQKDALLPWLSIVDNIMLGHRLRRSHSNEEKQKALHLLDSMKLSDHQHKKVYELSGGMRQRVALARTLLEDRPIVLMDEPFANLDVNTRYHLQNLTIDVLKSKTVLWVTHDPFEALRLGDHVRLMTSGDQGVEISEPIILKTPTPRIIDDPEIKNIYTTLLSTLIEKESYETT